jgi:hypothetical protein
MRWSFLTVGVVGLVVSASSMALAQEVVPVTFRSGAGMDNTSLAASDTPKESAPMPEDVKAAQNQQVSLAMPSEEAAPPEPPKPWKMPQPSCLQKMGANMGGWVQQGITYNGLNPTDRFNGPIVTNDRAGEYQLNQFWMFIDRPTNTDKHDWDLGGHIDMTYGTDWRFGQCYGLEPTFNDPDSFYGLCMPQFYAEVAVNNLKVKLGHFATLDTLEVVPAPMNFFYSHALLMAGYFDPLLVTGVQAEYKLNEHWTAVAGFNEGWMNFEDPDGSVDFLGGCRYASDNKKSTLSIFVNAGPEQGFAGLNDRTSVTTVYVYNLTDRFQWGSQYTAGVENHGSIVHPGQDASWYGTEQMFIYKLNDKWSAGLRYEWVRDNDGSRVAGVGNVLLTERGWDGLPGCAGAYNDLSLGLNWRPHPNCVLRPEVRWDWYDGVPNSRGQLPYGDHTQREQFTSAVDCIVTF